MDDLIRNQEDQQDFFISICLLFANGSGDRKNFEKFFYAKNARAFCAYIIEVNNQLKEGAISEERLFDNVAMIDAVLKTYYGKSNEITSCFLKYFYEFEHDKKFLDSYQHNKVLLKNMQTLVENECVSLCKSNPCSDLFDKKRNAIFNVTNIVRGIKEKYDWKKFQDVFKSISNSFSNIVSEFRRGGEKMDEEISILNALINR